MNRKHLAGVLLKFLFILSLIVLSAFPTKAQDIPDYNLDKIIVTNRRSPVRWLKASENLTVIGRDDILKLPVNRNLSEILEYVAGVAVSPRQGFGRATSLSTQGSDSRQVRVMIDGIPLNPQSSGQVNPAMFAVENIERIEIIKGASSSLWGSALGGVINIITKDTGSTKLPKGSLSSSFAEFRTKK